MFDISFKLTFFVPTSTNPERFAITVAYDAKESFIYSLMSAVNHGIIGHLQTSYSFI